MLEIDYHSHLIPGVDDGSRGGLETVQMARALERLGVRTVHLTPHRFRFGWGLLVEEVEAEAQAVGRLLDRADVSIELVPSSEHYFCQRLVEAIVEDEPLATVPWSQGDDPQGQAILIEIPTRDPVVGVSSLAKRLLARGIRPIMAHPERTRALHRTQERADGWPEAGWCFQLDLMSLVGAYGRGTQALAEAWVREGRYAVTGSDLHRPAQIQRIEQAHARFRELVG